MSRLRFPSFFTIPQFSTSLRGPGLVVTFYGVFATAFSCLPFSSGRRTGKSGVACRQCDYIKVIGNSNLPMLPVAATAVSFLRIRWSIQSRNVVNSGADSTTLCLTPMHNGFAVDPPVWRAMPGARFVPHTHLCHDTPAQERRKLESGAAVVEEMTQKRCKPHFADYGLWRMAANIGDIGGEPAPIPFV
ncbi:unnamed protein product [Soboliphyme baturini]|uniref:Uncharacterized protein n=1 Tax=Soboliphyme baturini TaxID=241478 RepID=A0A183IXJ6_9BILA|nr:unnamed protein product [Soboliphyme baturini]